MIDNYYSNETIITLFQEFLQCLIMNIFPQNQLKDDRITYSFDTKSNFFLNDVYHILEEKFKLLE